MTDWSRYARCFRCTAAAGAPCANLANHAKLCTVPHYGRPLRSDRDSIALIIRRPSDERVEVWLGQKPIGAFTHDEHGWSGMEAALDVATGLAKALGITIKGDR